MLGQQNNLNTNSFRNNWANQSSYTLSKYVHILNMQYTLLFFIVFLIAFDNDTKMRGHNIDLYSKQFLLLNGDFALVPQIMQNILSKRDWIDFSFKSFKRELRYSIIFSFNHDFLHIHQSISNLIQL